MLPLAGTVGWRRRLAPPPLRRNQPLWLCAPGWQRVGHCCCAAGPSGCAQWRERLSVLAANCWRRTGTLQARLVQAAEVRGGSADTGAAGETNEAEGGESSRLLAAVRRLKACRQLAGTSGLC